MSKLRKVIQPAWWKIRPYWKKTARLRHQVELRLRYALLPLHDKQPLFIIARQRTGGNLLCDYVDSIESVSLAHEFLNPEFYYGFRPGSGSKKDLILHIKRSLNALPGKITGCKILAGQLDLHKLSLEDLHDAFPDAKFLVLYRRDVFKQFVSLKVAHATKQYLAADDELLKHANINLDLGELDKLYQKNATEYAKVLSPSWMREQARIIAYEDVAKKPQETFDEIIHPFLGTTGSAVKTSLVKQRKRAIEEIVENYADIKGRVEGYVNFEPKPK